MPWVKTLVFALCLMPFLRLVSGFFTDGLGANPIEFITHSTGTWTLVFLLATLTITPLRRITGLNPLIRLRRMLGLCAFFYACLHFTTYLALDQFFEFEAIANDIVKRPYITMGFLAFLLLIPLAATSTRAMIARLGKRWQLLHRLVYLSAAAGVIHFLWLVKADLREPMIYASALTLLLGYRVVALIGQRKRPRENATTEERTTGPKNDHRPRDHTTTRPRQARAMDAPVRLS